MTGRVAGAGLACVVTIAVLAGCGEGGGGEAGEGLPSRSPGLSPTRTPDLTRTPAPTDEATDETTRGPTREPASEPTERESEPAEAQTSEPADEPATTSEADSGDESVPAGAWWLLAVVLLAGGALAWVLVGRSRRRGKWRDQMQAAEADVAWLARELLPQLRSAATPDRAAGGWQVALPRVAAAEDQLTVLASSAPSDIQGERARVLRDAVRQTRARMERPAGNGPDALWALDIDDAIGGLESALAHDRVVAR